MNSSGPSVGSDTPKATVTPERPAQRRVTGTGNGPRGSPVNQRRGTNGPANTRARPIGQSISSNNTRGSSNSGSPNMRGNGVNQPTRTPQRGNPGPRGRPAPGRGGPPRGGPARGGSNANAGQNRPRSQSEGGLDDDKPKESPQELDKKRLFVVRELVDTERTYSKSLNVLVEIYVEPLGKAANSSHVILPQDQLYIFDNLPVMAKISAQLLSDLQNRLEAWEASVQCNEGDSTSLCISDVFTQLLPFMKMYASYRTQVDFNHLRELYEQYPKFDDYCNKMHSDPRSNGQNLDSMLIMPIQRIPRYILLLETYLKYTDPSYRDYEGLQAALNLVKDVAGHVNSAHAEVDNKMLSLCMRFGEEFNELVEPWRSYISEVKLKTVTGTKKNSQILVVLLSDHIVFATPKNKSKYKGKLDLVGCWLIPLPDDEENQNMFTIYNPVITYTFSCDSPEQKSEWTDLIASTIEKTAQDPRIGQTRRSELVDSAKLNSKKGSDAFFDNPFRATLSPSELSLLKSVIKEPEVPEDSSASVKKEKKDEKKKDDKDEKKKKDDKPSSSSSLTPEVKEKKIDTGSSIDDRIKQYKEATKAPESPIIKSKKAPKMKNKHVKQIQSTMSSQQKKSRSGSKIGLSTTARPKTMVARDVIKKGELTKKGAFVKNWKDRYWILSSDTLSYFKSASDSEPVGEIQLRGCEVRDPHDAADKNYFELVAPYRTYYLRANSEELCKEWASAIESQITIITRGKIVKEGFLTKQGKVRKSWKKRFCVLDETNLQYFRQKSDSKPAGSILIKKAQILPVSKKESGKEFCFGITTMSRTFLMFADTAEQAEEWIQLLKQVSSG